MKKKLDMNILVVLFIIIFTLIAISYKNIYTSFLENKSSNIKKVMDEKTSEFFYKEEEIGNLSKIINDKKGKNEKLNKILIEKEERLRILQRN
jgi:spermidine/putrescine-binding protein